MCHLGPECLVIEDRRAEMVGPSPISASILNRGRELISLAISLALERGDPDRNGSPLHPITGFPSVEVRLISLQDHDPVL